MKLPLLIHGAGKAAGTLLLVVAGFFWMTASAPADLSLVQKVEGGGQAGEETIKIKGDKARTDLTPGVSMITDGATGAMITLMHNGRTYLKVPPEQTKSMIEQLQKFRAGSEPAKLQDTGKKEKIGDYDCEVFTTALGSMTVTYWLAKDYPNYPSLLAQLAKIQSGTVSAMGNGLLPDLKEFPGMIMKTEVEMSGKKIVTTLVSAKEGPVDPSVFAIPKDYTEVSSPELKFQSK